MSQSIIMPNRAKGLLRDGQPVIGTMVVEIRQPSVMQLLANAGFDFVIIDNEHGPFSIETLADLCREARHVGLTPIVRVPDWGYPHLAQPLDAGAQGLMIPRITDARQVREVVQMVQYPPAGRRGSALARGYTAFKTGLVSEVMAAVNNETLLIIQVETREAIQNLDEIAAVDGVDVLLVGPNDLSIALGVPGKLEDASFVETIKQVIKTCNTHEVSPALHINDVGMAIRWAQQGMRMLSISSEIGFIAKAGSEARTAIGQVFGR
jgi:2-keto-3-deoxy-L-rhamnonate aldolase RhmA